MCVVENGDQDGNGTPNEQYNVFFDENDGYYFAMKQTGADLNIGATGQ